MTDQVRVLFPFDRVETDGSRRGHAVDRAAAHRPIASGAGAPHAIDIAPPHVDSSERCHQFFGALLEGGENHGIVDFLRRGKPALSYALTFGGNWSFQNR